MSHFLVVCLLERPSSAELGLYVEDAAQKLAMAKSAEPGPMGISLFDPPLEDPSDKVMRTWAEGRLSNVLARYDENAEVAEHSEPCSCVGTVARKEVEARIDTEHPELRPATIKDRAAAVGLLVVALGHGDPDTRPRAVALLGEREGILRDLGFGRWFEAAVAGERLDDHQAVIQLLNKKDAELEDEWNATIAARDALRAEMLKAHPFADAPDPSCGRSRYQMLDLPIDATTEQINEAFRTKRAEYRKQKVSKDLMKYLIESHVILTNPDSRKRYDELGDDDDEVGCGGTGVIKTKVNPEGYWDWWTLGGRWTGVFKQDDYDPEMDPRNFEPCRFCEQTGLVNADGPPYHAAKTGEPTQQCHVCEGTKVSRAFRNAEFAGDIVPAQEYLGLLESKDGGASRQSENRYGIPYALITLDGEWHSQGRMGWFGMSDDELTDQEWYERVKKLVKDASPRCLAIAVDCHV